MNLSSWMSQTVTASSPTGSSISGDPTWGAQRTLPARVEPNSRRVVAADGTVVNATHRVFTLEPLTVLDRVWLPGTDLAKTVQARRPLVVVAMPTKAGVTSHYETSF